MDLLDWEGMGTIGAGCTIEHISNIPDVRPTSVSEVAWTTFKNALEDSTLVMSDFSIVVLTFTTASSVEILWHKEEELVLAVYDEIAYEHTGVGSGSPWTESSY